MKQNARSNSKKTERSRLYTNHITLTPSTDMNCMILPLVVREVASGHLVVVAVPLWFASHCPKHSHRWWLVNKRVEEKTKIKMNANLEGIMWQDGMLFDKLKLE